jgi:multidrug resistance efflux pump
VKAGQLLAEIDTPDVDQQILQAKAELAITQANAAFVPLEVGQSTQCVEFSLEYWV